MKRGGAEGCSANVSKKDFNLPVGRKGRSEGKGGCAHLREKLGPAGSPKNQKGKKKEGVEVSVLKAGEEGGERKGVCDAKTSEGSSVACRRFTP